MSLYIVLAVDIVTQMIIIISLTTGTKSYRKYSVNVQYVQNLCSRCLQRLWHVYDLFTVIVVINNCRDSAQTGRIHSNNNNIISSVTPAPRVPNFRTKFSQYFVIIF